LILDKVAKVDDSLVPSHLWDNWCKMVLPQLTDSMLVGFCTLVLIWQWKYMFCQFCMYLCTKFGPDWLAHLLCVRWCSHALMEADVTSIWEGPPPHKQVWRGVFPLRIPLNQVIIFHLGPACFCTWTVMWDVRSWTDTLVVSSVAGQIFIGLLAVEWGWTDRGCKRWYTGLHPKHSFSK
jgi:hypothetical protein